MRLLLFFSIPCVISSNFYSALCGAFIFSLSVLPKFSSFKSVNFFINFLLSVVNRGIAWGASKAASHISTITFCAGLCFFIFDSPPVSIVALYAKCCRSSASFFFCRYLFREVLWKSNVIWSRESVFRDERFS